MPNFNWWLLLVLLAVVVMWFLMRKKPWLQKVERIREWSLRVLGAALGNPFDFVLSQLALDPPHTRATRKNHPHKQVARPHVIRIYIPSQPNSRSQ
jgi:lipoprotein signal peptidase